MKLSNDQKAACNLIYRWWLDTDEKVFVLEGQAGTGKTFIAKRITELLPGCDALFTAPTNEALKQLELAVGEEVELKTTYSALGFRFDTKKEIPTLIQENLPQTIFDYNLIIVDEGSYVGLELYEALLDLKIKILFLGHRSQLPPVGEEDKKAKVFGINSSKIFCSEHKMYNLSDCRRQDGELLKFCQIVEKAITDSNITIPKTYNKNKSVFSTQMEKELSNIFAGKTKILSWTNKVADNLNVKIRRAIYKQDNPNRFLKGDKILLTTKPTNYCGNLDNKNIQVNFKLLQKEAKLLSISSKYTVLKCAECYCMQIPCYKLMVSDSEEQILFLYVAKYETDLKDYWDSQLKISFKIKSKKGKQKHFEKVHFILSLFAHVKYDYALTIHRSQGMSIENVIFLASTLEGCVNLDLRKKLYYVAVSRSRNTLTIY